MCFVGIDILGNHAMAFISPPELRASHDNRAFMVSRNGGVKGEEKDKLS